jgi:hypothetical protein
MALIQEPDSRQVEGTITVLGTTIAIEGTTGYLTETTGNFNWSDTAPGCGEFSGHFDVEDLSTLSGNARLDSRVCANPGFFNGVIAMSKVSSSVPEFESSAPGTGRTPEDLAREMAVHE